MFNRLLSTVAKVATAITNTSTNTSTNTTTATVSDKAIRDKWKVGSYVQIFSVSNNKWFKGKIIEISYDDENDEFLKVQYDNNTLTKAIPRYNKHIIPYLLSRNDNKSITKNKKRKNPDSITIESTYKQPKAKRQRLSITQQQPENITNTNYITQNVTNIYYNKPKVVNMSANKSIGKDRQKRKLYEGRNGAIYYKPTSGNKAYMKDDKYGHILYHGPNGGVYYNHSGNKVYVVKHHYIK